MIKLEHIRDLDVAAGEGANAAGYVSAASGLVRIGDFLHVIADDDLSLATFRIGDASPGRLFRLVPGTLPRKAADRKKAKPDFETLVALPPAEGRVHGALLALGSGSRPNRLRGALIELSRDGAAQLARPVDISALYQPFANDFAELNIEGAVVLDGRLLLFQRGNAGNPVNAVISFPLEDALATLHAGPAKPAPPATIRIVDLGTVAGVPLAFTDATVVDGMMVFSAVAENTGNAYDDGPLAGAVVGIIDAAVTVRRVETLHPMVKVEGIAAMRDRDVLRLTLVTDADDPAKPAGLFSATLPL